MRTIETRATVGPDGKLTIQLPPDIPAGEHQVVIVIEERVAKSKKKKLDLPVIHVGKWPEDLSLRREDMYGDDGR
jgi:hypothetical protein